MFQEEDGHQFSNCLMNKRIYKKKSHEKNKMEKKIHPTKTQKKKGTTQREKNPQIYSIKLKIVCFSS